MEYCFKFVDCEENPISSSDITVSINDVELIFDTDCADGYYFNADNSDVLSLSVDSTVYSPYEATFVPESADTGLTEIVIRLSTIGEDCETYPSPCFYWYQNLCSNQITFIPLFQNGNQTFYWNLGNGVNLETVGGFTYDYNQGGGYSVTLSLRECTETSEPDCCGGASHIIRTCVDVEVCSQTIAVNRFTPNGLFTIECQTSANNTTPQQSDCIQGCNGCSCDDIAFCRCINLNENVNLTPQFNYNLNQCPDDLNPGTLEIYVNGIIEEDLTIVSSNQETLNAPISLSFVEKGNYEIKLTAINCCGSCSFTRNVNVGPPLELKRVKCGVFTFEDYTNYTGEERIRVDIKDVYGNIISQYLLTDYNQETPPTFTISGDGIFIVTFNTIDSEGIVLTEKAFVLYEFCGIIECYTKLAIAKLCSSTECVSEKENKELGDMLNQFVIIASGFFASLDIQYGTTYGLFYYDDQYLGLLKNHQTLLNTLQKVCGNCGYIVTNSGRVTSSCSSCNGNTVQSNCLNCG